MYEMLTHMSPPLGLGKKCPAKIAYKVTTSLTTARVTAEMKSMSKSNLFHQCYAIFILTDISIEGIYQMLF
jgi:hypothetical protein